MRVHDTRPSMYVEIWTVYRHHYEQYIATNNQLEIV
jgi:hypothetical protein